MSLLSCKMLFLFRYYGVFPFCCKSATDMPLLLVDLQNVLDLFVKLGRYLFQPLAYVLMNRTFAYPELPCRRTDSGFIFDDILSQHDGTFIRLVFQYYPPFVSTAVNNLYACFVGIMQSRLADFSNIILRTCIL